MPIVYPTVENPDELLAWPATEGPVNRIQIERSSTGGGAGYANIGSVTILAATRSYRFYDSTGATADWYRWYLSNAANTFPTSGQRDYSPEIQPGRDAGSGLLVDPWDVKQRLAINATDTTKDELILEFISRVSTGIMGYTGRRFARNPSSGTKTFLFDVRRTTKTLWVPKGIAEMSQLEVATQTGGAFTVVPAADWFLDPPETERDHGWPATQIVISDIPTGTIPYFYPGKRVVRATMAEGWATVPGDIAGIAEDEVIRRYQGRGQGYTAAESGEGFIRLLRANAPDDAARLTWYRSIEMV